MPKNVEEKLLQKVTAILEELGIPYGITGGFAIIVWGKPRFTADIDIVIKLEQEQAHILVNKLLKIDSRGYVDEDTVREAISREGSFNFIHPASGLKVDFMVIGEQPYDLEQMRRRIARNFAGQTIFFISPENLILNKLLWYKEGHSTKQLEDIQSIIAIQKKLDWSYLKKWARIQETEEILGGLMKK